METLVGRDRPLAVLEAEIDRTVDSHGGLVFVAGEAGIGKTALAAEAAEIAGRRGALVASGTCWDRDDAPGYWPWVQVLRRMQRTMTPEAWTAALAAAGGELASLLGDIRARGGSSLAPAGDQSFGLHDAVTTLLVTASRDHPLLVVLDDLHWADPPSIRLLEFVARHAWFEQLLVIGTYRDAEVEAADHPLASLLLPLAAKATSVTLTGLDEEEVGVLLARTSGRKPSEETVVEVHRKTGGNPFFVDQTAHVWQSSNSVDAIPPGIRDAIERRLQMLPQPVLEVLTAASVLGPEFDRDVLTAVVEMPSSQVDHQLGEAASARLVVRKDDKAQLAFVHDLVRETLYASLDDTNARRRHAAVVRAFEQVADLAPKADPAGLAHHASRGLPYIAPGEVVALLRAAARDASSRLATDEAAGHLQRALELVPYDQPRDRAAIALSLGEALHHAGAVNAGRQAFQDVVAIARKLDDAELLARAALKLRGSVWLVHPPEIAQLTTDLVNEAHAKLVGARHAGDPGRSEPETTDVQREQELTARAIELAREAGDDEALLEAFCARYDAIWGLDTTAERKAIADEVLDIAHRSTDRSWMLYGSMLRMLVLLELGDPRCLDEHRFALVAASDLNSAFSCAVGLWSQASFATLTGRFDDARTYLDEAQAFDQWMRQRSGDDEPGDMAAMWFQQRWTIELLQDRFDEADALVGPAEVAGHPRPELFLAISAAERGDVQKARGYYAEVDTTGDAAFRWFQPLWLRLRAQVAAASDDRHLRQEVREELSLVRNRWLTMFNSTVDGPVMFWLALLDATEELWDDAVRGFTAAREAADRLGTPPWAIKARLHLAKALLGRASPGDIESAASLLEDVEQEAAAHGMEHTADQARRIGSAYRTTAASDAQPAAQKHVPSGLRTVPGEAIQPVTRTPNAFRRAGKVWTLTYDGITVHVPDAKGLRDLHILISQSGTDVRAVDLLASQGGNEVRAARRLGGDPILDEKAKAAYRTRLEQLDEQIDRALGRQDDQRAAVLDNERAQLIEEIRRATGLGGRPRRLGDEAERARKAVTERIRDSLRRLDQVHPTLAEHLRASVSTGASCRYQPAEDLAWTVR